MAIFNKKTNTVFGGVQFYKENNWNNNEENNWNNKNESNNSCVEGNTQNASVNTDFVGNEKYNSFKTINTEINNQSVNTAINFQPITKEKAIAKQSLWSKIRAFLFKEIDFKLPIKIELTPYQQKIEDEINEFLHQDVSFKNITKIFSKKK